MVSCWPWKFKSLELWHRYAPSYVLYVNVKGTNGSAGWCRLRTCDHVIHCVMPSKVETRLYTFDGAHCVARYHMSGPSVSRRYHLYNRHQREAHITVYSGARVQLCWTFKVSAAACNAVKKYKPGLKPPMVAPGQWRTRMAITGFRCTVLTMLDTRSTKYSP